MMNSVAVAIICKTPQPGFSKTRLSPPLRPEECAEISACFISDLAGTIARVAREGASNGYAVYTPIGSERELSRLLPAGFGTLPQHDGTFGERLYNGITDLLNVGHAGAIMVNSDSPTLPRSILRQAIAAVRAGDNVVLSPAFDGGYTLIGLSRPYRRLFDDIPWSTDEVFGVTLERAGEIGLPVQVIDGWYDVDDAGSYATLKAELNGIRPAFAKSEIPLEQAPATRRFVRCRQSAPHMA